MPGKKRQNAPWDGVISDDFNAARAASEFPKRLAYPWQPVRMVKAVLLTIGTAVCSQHI